MDTTSSEAVNALILRAKECPDSNEALKFSQAACNVANALAALHHMRKDGAS